MSGIYLHSSAKFVHMYVNKSVLTIVRHKKTKHRGKWIKCKDYDTPDCKDTVARENYMKRHQLGLQTLGSYSPQDIYKHEQDMLRLDILNLVFF